MTLGGGREESIILKNGELVYETKNQGLERTVTFLVTRQKIYLGCHEISREAYEYIKKRVDSK